MEKLVVFIGTLDTLVRWYIGTKSRSDLNSSLGNFRWQLFCHWATDTFYTYTINECAIPKSSDWQDCIKIYIYSFNRYITGNSIDPLDFSAILNSWDNNIIIFSYFLILNGNKPFLKIYAVFYIHLQFSGRKIQK